MAGLAKAARLAKSAGKTMGKTVLREVFEDFKPNVKNFTVNGFDKIAFDCDVIGRKRTILMMEENARAEYEGRGMKVNIAIWNMHLDEDHHFDDILESGIMPMGNGGGFRIVVFQGKGWIRNDGARGFDNWCCSGNQSQKHNKISFGEVE